MRRTLRGQAARTGISATSLRRAVQSGELEHTRLTPHGWVYLTDTAVDRWIDAHTLPATSAPAASPRRRPTPATAPLSVPRESALL